jgi:succinate dehydrogenase / fumarate reductase cytochrome b subunit
MQATRPVHLALWRIKLPATGYVSILHRISGVLMVLAIPVGAVLFDLAVSGPKGYAMATGFLNLWLVRLALLVIAWSFLHHLFAGIRYLLLDLRIGLDREASRKGALIVLAASLATLVLVLFVRMFL